MNPLNDAPGGISSGDNVNWIFNGTSTSTSSSSTSTSSTSSSISNSTSTSISISTSSTSSSVSSTSSSTSTSSTSISSTSVSTSTSISTSSSISTTLSSSSTSTSSTSTSISSTSVSTSSTSSSISTSSTSMSVSTSSTSISISTTSTSQSSTSLSSTSISTTTLLYNLHDSPGGINSGDNSHWQFNATSTSTSTSSTSTSVSTSSTSDSSTSSSISMSSTSDSSTSSSISSTSTSTSSTSTSSTSTSLSTSSTSFSRSSTSSTSTSISTTSLSTSSSTSATTLPPYTSQVVTGFGLNVRTYPQDFTQLMAQFQAWGLEYVRPYYPGAPIPWIIDLPEIPLTESGTIGNVSFWRGYAQTWSEAGFKVLWGYAGGVTPITSSNWQAYHDSVVAEAIYLQEQGIALWAFDIGNELELKIDKTTVTFAILHQYIRQLAADVKAVYTLGMVTYSSTDSSYSNFDDYADWIATGIGELDLFSIHPYGNINISKQIISPGGYSLIQEMMQAFPGKVFISEFNLDAGNANILALNENAQITNMQNFLHNYILKYRVPVFMFYDFAIRSADVGFSLLNLDGTYNPLLNVFFTQQSSLKPRISAPPTPLIEGFQDGSPNALVDDPVYLVDDPNVLVGNENPPSENRRTDTSTDAPRGSSSTRR